MLKVILASLLLIRVPDTKKECRNEYDLINYLVHEKKDSALVDERLLSWREYGYESFKKLNSKNYNLGGQLEKFDLDGLFDEEQKQLIDEFLQSRYPGKVNLGSISFKNKIIKTKGSVPKKTIYSYSYPIVLKGIDEELYGIILERETFEVNNELKLKVFVKRSYSWELVLETLKEFSVAL